MKKLLLVLTLLAAPLSGCKIIDWIDGSDDEDIKIEGNTGNININKGEGEQNVQPAPAPTPVPTATPTAEASLGFLAPLLILLLAACQQGCAGFVRVEGDLVQNLSPSASANLLSWKSAAAATTAQGSGTNIVSEAAPANDGGGSVELPEIPAIATGPETAL